MQGLGLDKGTLGFSNSRMAYEDIIAKFCYTLDKNTLLEKVTSSNITSKYREQQSFSHESVERAKASIILLNESSKYFLYKAKFNKATLYSWLCF